MKAEWTNTDALSISQMTKAILVIDMPKNCAECKLCDGSNGWGDWKCVLSNEYLPFEDYESNERALYCPLRPLPQMKEPNEKWLNEYHRDDFADGWNACLEEIEGD